MSITATPVVESEVVAGRYAAQSDIEDRVGIDNVRAWSNLDNSGTSIDTARVSEALTWADAQIDFALRGGPYAVPLKMNGDDSVVRDWSGWLAAAWLLRARASNRPDGDGPSPLEMERRVRLDLSRCRNGMLRLDATPAHLSMPQSPQVIE